MPGRIDTREATQEKEKEILNPQKEKIENQRKTKLKYEIKLINTPTTRGE